MECLRSRPAFPIGLEHTMDFPIRTVGHQDLARFAGPFVCPQHHDPHRMVEGRNADALGEIPLGQACYRNLAPAGRTKLAGDPLADDAFLSVDADLAVGLQVTHIRSSGAGHVIEYLSIGEVAIESEVARNSLGHDPIDQLTTQVGVRTKRPLSSTDLTLAEASKG